MSRISEGRRPFPAPFLALCCLLICAFLLGGSSRSDLTTLIVLRPVAVLILGFAFWGLRWDQVRNYRFLIIVAGLIVLLPLVQLLPLPPALWTALPGHDVVATVDQQTGLGAIWRPISLVPDATWNALFSLAVPAAALVLAIRLTAEERERLLPVLIGIMIVSALLGVIQVIGRPGSAFYFYRVTHDNSAVGLFANRNHQAAVLACLFPMAAVYASLPGSRSEDSKSRPWLALVLSLFLIPLILITGSRTGMFAGLLGMGLALFLYHRRARREHGRRARRRPLLIYGATATAAVALAAATILLGRAESFVRVLAFDPSQDARFANWKPVAEIAGKYMPFGSGFGSFADVFKLYEPREALHSSYFNQAHNDWLEVAMTGGLPAILLLVVVVIAVVRRGLILRGKMRKGDTDERFAGLGLAIIVIFAFASTTDYPLRVPSIACMFVIAAVWAAAPQRRGSGPDAQSENGLHAASIVD